MTKEKIKVLVIDDSAVVRQTMTSILESDPDIEVIATAGDPFIAANKLRKQVPDVITLDVEMPRMDGLTFLQKLMHQHPIPVVMCSSLTERGTETALRALELGAVDIITKPKLGVQHFLEEAQITVCDAVKAAAGVKTKKVKPQSIHPPHTPGSVMSVAPKLTADAVIAQGTSQAMIRTTEKVVVVGASTGGTEALREFIEALPTNCPGIVVVQHMPEKFTASFAQRLNATAAVTVKEAEDNDTVLPGRVLIAPGGLRHTLIKRSGARYYVTLKEGPLVTRHRPSVDVLFRSASRYAGKNAVGIIMTGMGDDGARGMAEMKEAGAYNIAQDEQSCVVFGMPKEAIKHGGVDIVLSLSKIAVHLTNHIHSHSD
ncbi:MAG: chemotaxis response regulator protein-glutamate methylesterase [Deltaproteobacteria bacterium]|nr:chemotaxis response regulator protein-glutamate methylesterase [Deltaproteobacteria bacterium]MBN2674467.1 chemotaxis response regulator protein-glutamate methylesterase [Deltaproteobacteria bacterium]